MEWCEVAEGISGGKQSSKLASGKVEMLDALPTRLGVVCGLRFGRTLEPPSGVRACLDSCAIAFLCYR